MARQAEQRLPVLEEKRTIKRQQTQVIGAIAKDIADRWRLSSDNQDENVATIKVRTRGRDATSARTMAVVGKRGKWERGGSCRLDTAPILRKREMTDNRKVRNLCRMHRAVRLPPGES